MNPINTTAPALPADLEAMMRSLKMPHARALAPELIATARAQRWEPVEVIKALFTEEIVFRQVHVGRFGAKNPAMLAWFPAV